MSLPAYGSFEKCPACGRSNTYSPGSGPDASTKYCEHPGHLEDPYRSAIHLRDSSAPHHHRDCPRCGYSWIEATLLPEKAS